MFIGLREWLPPYRVDLALHGIQWADFAFFGDSFLVSKRVELSAATLA